MISDATSGPTITVTPLNGSSWVPAHLPTFDAARTLGELVGGGLALLLVCLGIVIAATVTGQESSTNRRFFTALIPSCLVFIGYCGFAVWHYHEQSQRYVGAKVAIDHPITDAFDRRDDVSAYDGGSDSNKLVPVQVKNSSLPRGVAYHYSSGDLAPGGLPFIQAITSTLSRSYGLTQLDPSHPASVTDKGDDFTDSEYSGVAYHDRSGNVVSCRVLVNGLTGNLADNDVTSAHIVDVACSDLNGHRTSRQPISHS